MHGDILDEDLIKKHFKDADIVHHLAGITDVPRTKLSLLRKEMKKLS